MNSTQFWYSNDLVIQSCRLLHKCRGLWSRKMKKIFIWKKKIFIWNVFWRRRRDTCVNYRARQIDRCHTSHQISSSHQANCDFESLYICDNIVVPSIDNIKCTLTCCACKRRDLPKNLLRSDWMVTHVHISQSKNLESPTHIDALMLTSTNCVTGLNLTDEVLSEIVAMSSENATLHATWNLPCSVRVTNYFYSIWWKGDHCYF